VLLTTASFISAFAPLSQNAILKISSSSNALQVSAASESDTTEGADNVNISTPMIPESASLLPGQIVSIRIGDTSSPRKAWKKRRRTGSPVLVPCTILGVDRESMVKWNIMNLLHRFGKPQKHDSHNGVVLSVGAMVKLYKHRMGGDLLQHANSLGYRTIVLFLKDVFSKESVRDHGVQTMKIGPKRELVLSSSLSLRLARESAYRAEFVQFQPSSENDGRMAHVGTTFQLEKEEKYTTFTNPEVVHPLSAAVRISQSDSEAGRFREGMECNAFFHTYDSMGDNGSPLLTCAIDPPREQIRDQMKRRNYVKRQIDAKERRVQNKAISGGVGRDLSDLKIGDGPFTATVVKVSPRAGAVFVDAGVSRHRGKKTGGGDVEVLGMLRFDDIGVVDDASTIDAQAEAEAALIEASLLEGSDEKEEEDDGIMTVEDLFMDDEEEGEEIVEDVSDLYSMDEDGNISLVDPETGEKQVIGSADSDVDDEDEDDNIFAAMSPQERLEAIGAMLETEEEEDVSGTGIKEEKINTEKQLEQGDKVNVYIRAVFPQSGRFMVTMDSSIKGKKLKDMKREKEANKRLEKLTSKMGGDEGLQNILSSVGLQIEGVVKAKSKTGDWYYIQPEVEGFPVGIAQSEIDEDLASGDRAKIRVDGIDESRGQLALTVLEKLE